MTFLAVLGSGVVPNPLFTSSPGCKSGPPGCKAVVGIVEIADDSNDTNLQIGWTPLLKCWLRSQIDFSKCRGLNFFVGSESSSQGPCHKTLDPRRCGTMWVLSSRVWIVWRA